MAIQVSVYGRLGSDPVERETRNGKAMVTVSMAVNVARYGVDEDTAWFSIAAFGSMAETLAKHAKGDMVAVLGPLTRRKYTDRAGVEKESWSVAAEALVSARTTRPGGKRKPANGDGQMSLPAGGGQDDSLNDSLPWGGG